MKKQSKLLISAALLGLTGMVSVSAADVYELNPVVVTAQRIEKTEINTPVTETIVTTKKIEEAGYKNAFDIIEHQVGLSSTGYGDAGQDFGFSAGRTVVRGYDRGTLVMVDGIPINLKNYNSLDGIPVDMIEKVEIIKGASGTLYGAEAMGGVINIITKRPEGMKPVFKVKGTVGNYYKDYGVNYSDARFIIGLQKEYSNKNDNANDYPGGSDYDWRTGKGQKNRATVVAKVTDEITANLMYQDGHITRWSQSPKKPKSQYNYNHKDRRMTAGIHYAGKDNGIEATVGYNARKIYGDSFANNKMAMIGS
ncbi:MAG: TonB-dependent receptor plug domain-containing protein, partial [Dialister sp.]|nr:TonB-dependent receptor plug domain-containing protein [Dialister sp.]